MAGRAELRKRKRKPVPMRAFAEHLAADPVVPLRRGLTQARALRGRRACRRVVPRPVLLADDVTRLRGRSEEMVRATIAVLATFPAARVV